MDVRLVPNQSKKGKYNLISVWFNNISKRFLCMYKRLQTGKKQQEQAYFGIMRVRLRALWNSHHSNMVWYALDGCPSYREMLVSQAEDRWKSLITAIIDRMIYWDLLMIYYIRGVSRHIGGPIEDPSICYCCDGPKGFRGPSTEPAWRRETPVSQFFFHSLSVHFAAPDFGNSN